ncbi:hypothetical protein DFW101_0901 [Solidesulfovibrio carbinoliphilus subsp. oakridgensis]|uniref:Uncharacterized protein n=1 Tax=Solidesulfovibrio carbinoliphilus subsp. oakridgensis TaxID=694327 RepID=G7Q5Y0_9BACT|nr:hypothetical protein DFW101_0901 [Solidesulfovibrio carbinoliphilus subsp. oakridgensis]
MTIFDMARLLLADLSELKALVMRYLRLLYHSI